MLSSEALIVFPKTLPRQRSAGPRETRCSPGGRLAAMQGGRGRHWEGFVPAACAFSRKYIGNATLSSLDKCSFASSELPRV